VQKEKWNTGVNFIGRVPNNELAKYYQISDFYLFQVFGKRVLHCSRRGFKRFVIVLHQIKEDYS
jgi:hypothetical protein